MDAQLVAMLGQTIYVAAASSINSSGQLTWGAPASRLVRVEEKRQLIRTSTDKGDTEVMTTHRIFTRTEIKITDRVWLPGDSSADNTKARRILQVSKVPGETGNTEHYEVLI